MKLASKIVAALFLITALGCAALTQAACPPAHTGEGEGEGEGE